MKLIFFSIGLLVCCFSCQNPSTETKQPALPPNVLLIIGDDHGYADLGVNNLASDINTPNLDKLAKSGVRFTNAYASSPICSPSRVGLMTGAYHQRQKVFWYGGNGLSNPEIPTIAELLSQKGYATSMIGKFHFGSNDANLDHRSFPLNHGFQELFGFNGGRKHYLIHNNEEETAFKELMKKAVKPKQSLRMEGIFRQDKRVNTTGFTTELLGSEAIDFIKKQESKAQPYFLTLSFNAVHNFTHQLPQAYLDANGLKGYHDWDPTKETYYDWYNKGRKPNNPEGREHYLGQLHYLDKEIGKVITHLEQNKQLENTIIIYIGDNGGSTQIYANNTPYSGGKYTMYEGGLRIPLLISWKGKYQQNLVSENLVSALDVLPTLVEATGATLPTIIDGLSLHPLLIGKNPNIGHEKLYWFGGEQAAIRSGKWKYRWANDAADSFAKSSSTYEGVALDLGHFLTNLETDPGEKENLVTAESAILERLQEELTSWKTDLKISN